MQGAGPLCGPFLFCPPTSGQKNRRAPKEARRETSALKSVLRQSRSDNSHGIAPTKCPILRGPVGIKMLRAAKPPFCRDFCSAKMLVRRFRAAPSSSQSSLVSVSASRRKLRPLPCSSSPHPTRCRWARAGNPCIGTPRSIPWQGEQNTAGPQRCLPIRKHRGAREKRYSFGYAVFLILALMKLLWIFPGLQCPYSRCQFPGYGSCPSDRWQHGQQSSR